MLSRWENLTQVNPVTLGKLTQVFSFSLRETLDRYVLSHWGTFIQVTVTLGNITQAYPHTMGKP